MQPKRKYRAMILLQLLAMIVCCSCNSPVYRERSEEEQGQESLDAVAMAHTVFKNSETTAKKKRLENDFIRVWKRGRSGRKRQFMQENLDGTDQKIIPIPKIENALWLTNDWFYYSVMNKYDMEVFYRTPVSYDGNQATIDTTGKKERLFKQGEGLDLEDFMVTDLFVYLLMI